MSFALPVLAARRRGGGSGPGGSSIALADARLIANWNNVSELDDQSILDATYTESGSPIYGDGSAELDGSTDYWVSAESYKNYHFVNAGQSFTIEFFAVRPDADNSVVMSTSTEDTATRGFIVRIDTDGSVKLHIFQTTSGAPITGSLFDAGTIPAGAGAYDGLHHIVIEGYHLAREVDDVALVRIGVNGARTNVVQRDHFNTNFLSTDGATEHTLRVGRGNTSYFDGTLGRSKLSRGLVYNLWENSTYTVPSGDFPTTETAEFKAFSARPSIDYRPDAPTTYRSFADTVYLGTPGHYGLIYHGASSHNNADGELYWQTNTTFGRGNWSDPVAITSSAAGFCATNPRLTRLASGRILLTYEEFNISTGVRNAKWRYTDNNGGSWSSQSDLRAAFSATMQGIGVGPTTLSGLVKTSNGPMLVGHANPSSPLTNTSRLEALFYDEGADSWDTPVFIGNPALALNETTVVRCDDDDKVVIFSRNENQRDSYTIHKNSTGGTGSWTFVGTVAYQLDDSRAGPLDLKEDGSGNIIALMTRRGANSFRQIEYTVTDAADFFTNPARAIDGTEVKTWVHRMNRRAGLSEIGYPRVNLFDGGFLLAWYEGVRNSTSMADVMVMGMDAMPATGKTWFNQLLLLTGDGTDTAANFRDESMYGRGDFTAYGNVQNDTGITLQGANTLLFDGTGDYLTLPFDDDFHLRNEDFTIDLFFRVGGGAGTNRFAMAVWNGTGSQRCWHIGLGTNNKMNFSWSTTGSGASGNLESTSTYGVGDTAHLRICRHGTTLRMFGAGVLEAKATGVATNLFQSSQPLIIGATNGGANSYWNGSLAEIRFQIGVAENTSDASFTPPVAPWDRF